LSESVQTDEYCFVSDKKTTFIKNANLSKQLELTNYIYTRCKSNGLEPVI